MTFCYLSELIVVRLHFSFFAFRYLRLIVSRLMYCPVSSLYSCAIRDQPNAPSSRMRKIIAKFTGSLGLPDLIRFCLIETSFWDNSILSLTQCRIFFLLSNIRVILKVVICCTFTYAQYFAICPME